MGYIEEIRKKIGHDLLIGVGAGVFVYKDGEVPLQKRTEICVGRCMRVASRSARAWRIPQNGNCLRSGISRKSVGIARCLLGRGDDAYVFGR